MGHRHAIVSLTEKKSRFALPNKVERKTAQVVGEAVVELLKSLAVRVHTNPSDKGRELADHERITRDLRKDVNFTHSYSS